MHIHQQLKRLITTTVFGLLMAISGASAVAGSFTIELNPTGTSSLGFGFDGLYLGNSFSNGRINCGGTVGPALTHPCLNWTWDDVTMTVEESTGDAVIAGTMTRGHNNETWGIYIELMDIEFRRPNQSYKDDGNYTGGVSQEMFMALQEGTHPFTGKDKSNKPNGWGFEWKSLTMALDKMGNSSAVWEKGWTGLAMPDIGHKYVAELHYDPDQDGLLFDAWYQNKKAKRHHSYYAVGDTKSYGGITPVPLPGALWLFGSAMFLLLGRLSASRAN